MTLIVAALLIGSMLCGLACRANVRFRRERRLPMQWWFDGTVTWCAPRPVALAAIPALALAVLLSFAVLSSNMRPRSGQEDMAFPAFIGIGALFLSIQRLHFWLIEKTLHRKDS